jgi:hypothetical protein
MSSSSACEVSILYEPKFLCRPWGVVCQQCGKVGAGASREEAERVGRWHEKVCMGVHQSGASAVRVSSGGFGVAE